MRLSGDTRSERWLQNYWQRGAAVEGVRRYLALSLASPPGVEDFLPRMICVCHGVTEASIHAALERGADTLSALQDALQCGTDCGSCVPELRGMLAARRAAA